MSTPPPSGSSWGSPSPGGLPGGEQPGGGWGNQPGAGQPQPGGWGGGAPGAGPGGAAAGWGSRVGATLLDGLILGVPFAILGGIFGAFSASSVETTTDPTTGLTTVSGGGGIGAAVAILYLLLFVAVIFYYGFFMSKWNGQTPGKKIVNIRATRLDGRPFTFGFALVREVLVKSILMGICFIVLILDWLWPLWDDNAQALHDKVISTRVVRA